LAWVSPPPIEATLHNQFAQQVTSFPMAGPDQRTRNRRPRRRGQFSGGGGGRGAPV